MKDTTPSGKSEKRWVADLLASSVVFLVALPLCIGIAVACGVPVERGLVTGIVGGILVGRISGAPLLVSGPAASLIVPVFDLIQEHGIIALAPVVILAGLWQVFAGVLKLGRWFRAVAPAVIQGMLTGIGVLILASQLHVCVDTKPKGSFLDNVLLLPKSFLRGDAVTPLLIALSTIILIVAWNRFRPRAIALLPGQLVALLVVSIVTLATGADVAFLDISPRFFDGLAPVSLNDFALLQNTKLITLSFVFAFVASAATLLTANAIDQRQTHSKADYDREILAQGFGNMATGALGGLPMTGVIVRSSVNVDAGAKTRWSTIMHGIWILLFVSAAPQALEMIPQAALGAILVHTGIKLTDYRLLVALYKQGRAELAICLITLFGVVFIDLFVGIVAGLVAAVAKIVYTFARLEIRSEPDEAREVQDLHLTGSATFLQLPVLSAALDRVPSSRELHVHIDRLDHIDHACLQLLSSWNQRRESEGLPGMIVEWDELTERYRNALVGTGARSDPPPSIMNVVWDEWKRIHAPTNRAPVAPTDPWETFIDASRVRVHIDGETIEDVLVAAADALAPSTGVPASEIAEALRSRIEGHVALGGGISVPHTPLRSVDQSHAALITTRKSIEVAGEQTDLFFVLVGPSDDPRKHLAALAHVGRLCHDETLLDDIRAADMPQDVAHLLRTADRSIADVQSGPLLDTRMLAVIEVDDGKRAGNVMRIVEEAFGKAALGSSTTLGAFNILRRVLGIDRSRNVVVTAIEERDVHVLHTLLEEEERLVHGQECAVHLLAPSPLPAAAPQAQPRVQTPS